MKKGDREGAPVQYHEPSAAPPSYIVRAHPRGRPSSALLRSIAGPYDDMDMLRAEWHELQERRKEGDIDRLNNILDTRIAAGDASAGLVLRLACEVTAQGVCVDVWHGLAGCIEGDSQQHPIF